jgi:hypothetical protein
MNILKIWGLVVLGYALMLGETEARADQLVWDTPVGNFNLNLETTESVIGYDAVLKQTIAGVSLPFYTDPKGIITLHVGADAPWQTNGATVEPLIMAGHNILAEIPGLNQFTSAQLNVFGRWSTEQGKAGVGLAFSYSFGSPPPAATVVTSTPAPTSNP